MKSIIFVVYLLLIIDKYVICNENLCNIQLYLNKNLNEIRSIESVNNQMQIIYTDTTYQVMCLTNETVRSRNFISLILNSSYLVLFNKFLKRNV